VAKKQEKYILTRTGNQNISDIIIFNDISAISNRTIMATKIKNNTAPEFPAVVTLRSVFIGPGNSGAFILTLSGIGNRSRTPGTLPGFPDTPQGESKGLLWKRHHYARMG